MKAGKKVNGADSGGPRRNPPKIDWDACLLLPCSLPWLRALLKRGETLFAESTPRRAASNKSNDTLSLLALFFQLFCLASAPPLGPAANLLHRTQANKPEAASQSASQPSERPASVARAERNQFAFNQHQHRPARTPKLPSRCDPLTRPSFPSFSALIILPANRLAAHFSAMATSEQKPAPSSSTSSVPLTSQLLSSFKPARVFNDHVPKGTSITSAHFDDRGEACVTAGEDDHFRIFSCRSGT